MCNIMLKHLCIEVWQCHLMLKVHKRAAQDHHKMCPKWSQEYPKLVGGLPVEQHVVLWQGCFGAGQNSCMQANVQDLFLYALNMLPHWPNMTTRCAQHGPKNVPSWWEGYLWNSMWCCGRAVLEQYKTHTCKLISKTSF